MPFYRSRLLWVLACVVLIFAGCKKKKVHCVDDISPIPYWVSFIGFDPEVLDTIQVHRYSNDPRDSSANYLVSDTAVTFSNDTSSPILYFHPGWIYEISFLNDERKFELRDPQYPKAKEWDGESCSSLRFWVSPPTSISVNGQQQFFKEIGTNNVTVYLK
jgi:hypothetical protein